MKIKKMEWMVVIICFFSVFFCSLSSADKVYLKTGQVIEGKILEKGSYYLIVQDGNEQRKVYDGEIDKIEEDANQRLQEVGLKEISKVSEEKRKLIKKLIEVNGTKEAMNSNIETLVSKSPKAQQEILTRVFHIDSVIDSITPLYAKYYTEEDLQGMIDFFQTPAGKKMVKVTPKIMQESIKTLVDFVTRQQEVIR